MNVRIYSYVQEICRKIKNKSDYDDVVQNVMLILCEKGLVDKTLDDGLKNYIKGIVFNNSTTLFNKDSQYVEMVTTDIKDLQHDQEEEYFQMDVNLGLMYSHIKKYVFDNYYMKERSLVRWKVFYLRLKGYDYHYIKKRLNITYCTALEYYSKSCIELKNNLTYN